MKKRFTATAIAGVFVLSLNPFHQSPANTGTHNTQQKRKITVIGENFQTAQTVIFEREARTEEQLQAITGQAVGTKSLAVIQASFSDNPLPPPFTYQEVWDRVFNPNFPSSVEKRFTDNSFGLFGITGNVFGPVVVDPPRDSSGNPLTGCAKGLAAVDEAAGAAGVKGQYDFYMLILPTRQDGCDFDGFAELQGIHCVLFDSVGGGTMYHELGHLLGLQHSRYIVYNGSQSIASSSCVNPSDLLSCEYGDISDPMGSGFYSNYAGNKFKLGWIPPADEAILNEQSPDQTITLSAIEDPAGTRMISIPISDGNGYSYLVDYSNADQRLPGVRVHLFNPSGVQYSYLIPAAVTGDANPADASLTQVGQVYTDPFHGVRIELVAISGTPTVHVTIPAGPIPNIAAVNYGGGKKMVLTGSNFGIDPHLLINGSDITNSVISLTASDSRIKIKAPVSVLNLRAGSNSIQVLNGSVISNPYSLTL